MILYWIIRLWGHFPAFMDTLEYVFPEKWFNVESFCNGRIPLWNPYVACGTPHVANLQSAAFYPFFWLWNWTGLHDWFFVLALLHGVLATVGFYLWMRSRKVQEITSVLCAVSFGGSALAVNYWGFPTHLASIAWVPWLFWAASRWMEKPSRFWWIAMAFFWVFQFLAGYPFFTFYATLFLLVWVVVSSRKIQARPEVFRRHQERNSIRKAAKFLLGSLRDVTSKEVWIKPLGNSAVVASALALGVLLTACQWLPFMDFLRYLHREGWNEHLFSLRWVNTLTLFHPQILGIPGTTSYQGDYPNFIFNNLYFGLVPLTLFLWSLVSFRKFQDVFWKVSALFWFFWLMGIHFWPWLILPDRLLDVVEPAKASFLFLFCVLTSLGLSIQEKMENSSMKNPIRKWAWVLGAVWFLDALLVPSRVISVVPDPYRDAEVIQRAKVAKQLTENGRMVSLRNQNQYYSPSVRTLADSFKESTEVLIPNINAVWGIKSARGYLSIFLDGYQNLSRYLQKGYPFGGRVLDAAGVKLIVFPYRLPDFKYSVCTPQGQSFFNSNAGALSDAWEVDHVREFPGRPQVFEALLNPNAFLENEVYTEKSPDGKAVRLEPVSRVLESGRSLWDRLEAWAKGFFQTTSVIEASRPSPTEATFRVSSPRPGYLVFDESFAPGWHAWVDGKPTVIFRANGMWMTVCMGDSGDHQVLFRYEPTAFRLGLFLTLVSLIGLGMFFIIPRMIKTE